MKNNTSQEKSKSGRNGNNSNRPGRAKLNEQESEGLRKLFIAQLQDIYWSEGALTKALPKMAEKATDPELVEAIQAHLEETEEHVTRLEQVFAAIGEKAEAKACEAMKGLLKEADEVVGEMPEGAVRDAAIIGAAQKVEHYEIATYGTLCAFAEALGETEAVGLLEETLQEEKAADEKLSEIAFSGVNDEAVSG
jgi:ferritin-like metal-binding protein YciE